MKVMCGRVHKHSYVADVDYRGQYAVLVLQAHFWTFTACQARNGNLRKVHLAQVRKAAAGKLPTGSHQEHDVGVQP
jgi:hypothetical protein